jgi:hypothetical protein
MNILGKEVCWSRGCDSHKQILPLQSVLRQISVKKVNNILMKIRMDNNCTKYFSKRLAIANTNAIKFGIYL